MDRSVVWRRSSRCGGGDDNCVEIAAVDNVVRVRDSTDAEGPWLRFDTAAWRQFVRGIVRFETPVKS